MENKCSVIEFNKLSKGEQRILIAQDVLLNLEAKRYHAIKQAYITNIEDEYFNTNLDIQTNFENGIKNCGVCALGSLLLSTIKYKDTLTFYDIYGSLFENGLAANLITDVFSTTQLCLIEATYENWDIYHGWSADMEGISEDGEVIDEEIVAKIAAFNDYQNTAEESLIAIMSNIIVNNGDFIL